MKYGAIIAGIVIIGLIAGGAWWVVSGKNSTEQSIDTSTDNNETTTTTEHEHTDDHQDENTEASVTITYSVNGFRTSKDTIAGGSTVLVINESSETLQFSSDPHPQHTDNSELNLPTLAPGEQETMVVDKPGKWGFHNHLNDDHSGSITVTD